MRKTRFTDDHGRTEQTNRRMASCETNVYRLRGLAPAKKAKVIIAPALQRGTTALKSRRSDAQ